jgi:hypothetical protein
LPTPPVKSLSQYYARIQLGELTVSGWEIPDFLIGKRLVQDDFGGGLASKEKIRKALVLWSGTEEQLGHKMWGVS